MLPHSKIHLLCYRREDLAAFKEALNEHELPDSYEIAYHTGSLLNLDRSTKFEAVVSPANSYGVMDGGFDDILSVAFSPPDDYYGLTNAVQNRLWDDWKGFAPPGTCTLAPFTFEKYGYGRVPSQAQRPWGCGIIAVCPTMRQPQDARWDREIVYECIWSMLCAVDNWNNTHEDKILSILMTPLATGVGGVPPERWARQTVLAMRHFDEACNNPAKWSRMRLDGVMDISDEVEVTYK